MAEVTKQYLDYAGLQTYDEKIKAFAQSVADKVKNDIIDGADGAYDTLKEIETYITTHKSEYEALQALVGNKVTKEELATEVARILALETKTTTLEETVNKLDGTAEVEGSVKKQIATAKADVEGQITALEEGAVKDNADAIDALEKGAVKTNTDAIAALKSKVEGLEGVTIEAIPTSQINALFTE